MDRSHERRKERRLNYDWSIWLTAGFGQALSQGQMVDLSSSGAAFTCYADANCPRLGQMLTARFSVPNFVRDESYEMASFTRLGRVCRIENVNPFMRRIAIQFSEPLSFRPGEQSAGRAHTA